MNSCVLTEGLKFTDLIAFVSRVYMTGALSVYQPCSMKQWTSTVSYQWRITNVLLIQLSIDGSRYSLFGVVIVPCILRCIKEFFSFPYLNVISKYTSNASMILICYLFSNKSFEGVKDIVYLKCLYFFQL